MTSTNSTMDAYDDTPRRGGAGGFIVLALLALVLGGVVLYLGRTGTTPAPLTSPYPEDWINWARAETVYSGLLLIAAVFFLIGFFGMLARMFAPRPKRNRARVSPNLSQGFLDDGLAIPAAPVKASPQGMTVEATEPPPNLFSAEPPSVEVHSLEPAIFHDNASDSFLSQTPVSTAPIAATPAVLSDALSDTHGLTVNSGAQVVQLRPEAAPVALPNDPVEAALLSEPMAAPSPAPQSDISAVIASAMHFAEPAVAVAAPVAAAVAVPEPVAAAPVAAPVNPTATDDQGEIRQAVAMALSVWPDSTRAIAADELNVRIARLYYDKSPESVRAFHLIATGDLSAAASALQSHADTLAHMGRASDAAEAWRIFGALHMGRDDSKAMMAYEKVSELDPSDANIHLYLARRYQMSGDTTRMLPVLGRALGVISDPQTRAELLAPYADLQLKAGNARAAGDAFEELSRLHQVSADLRPDDVAARSAQAITLARLAQARETHGAFDQAGPLYKQAHQVFAQLSAQKPDHPGLRAMADNALKDAQRFNQA